MSVYLHPTAIVEDGVAIGDHTSVWDNVHIRRDTAIGKHTIIGEKTHISYGVTIGSFVKINAFVYICTGVSLEDGVMISAGCIFTNDRFPRAANPELTSLRTSDPDEHTSPTLVQAGATLGAGCIIGSGFTIGRFAMVGMGSVVTRAVPDFALVVGNPARHIGYVCRCGEPVARWGSLEPPVTLASECAVCRRQYAFENGRFAECALEPTAVRV